MWRHELDGVRNAQNRDNVVDLMIDREYNWDRICCFIKRVMERKKTNEREHEAAEL